FGKSWPGAKVVTLGGEVGEHADVLVATVQGLSNRLDQFPEDHFGLLVVDEAHHAPASSWQAVINHFRPGLLLGCTATPERPDGEPLLPLFGRRVLYEYTLGRAIVDAHLVPLRQRAIFTTASLDGVRRSGRDLSARALAPVVVSQARTRAIVEGY